VKYGFGDVEKWITSTGRLAFRNGPSGNLDRISQDIYEVDASAPSKSVAAPRSMAKAGFGRNYCAEWSPDGKKLAYLRLRGAGATQPILCLQTLADGREETIEVGMARIVEMKWSPDSETLALRGTGPNQVGYHLFSLRTREPVNIPIPGPASRFAVGFSSDGQEFGFTDRDQNQRVWVNIKTGEKRTVSLPEQPAAKAGTQARRWVSPDKQKVAYWGQWIGGTAGRELHIAAVDGSWDRVVETGAKRIEGGIAGTSWSADSTKLAITLIEDFAGEIGVLENFLPIEKGRQKVGACRF
jgi:hypothetical protein